METVFYNTKYQQSFITLYQKIWAQEPYGELFTEAEVSETINKQEIIILAADADENVIGFISGYDLTRYKKLDELPASVSKGKTFYLAELGVAEEYRKQGYAKKMYQELEDLLTSKNYERIILRTLDDVANPAPAFYLKQGFKIIDGVKSKVVQSRVDNRPETDTRNYFEKDLSGCPLHLKGKYKYDQQVTRFKRRFNINAIIGISGGADPHMHGISVDDPIQDGYRKLNEQYQTRLIVDCLTVLKNYRIAVLTGGTKGGIPELATTIAKNMGLPTIGVFPEAGERYALSNNLLDLKICVSPMLGASCWGDEAPVWTSLVDGVVVIGGRSGTLIESAHLLKMNESLVKHNKRPKFIAPIISGGTSEKIASLCHDTDVQSKIMPTMNINSGAEAAKYLMDKLSLIDYFNYKYN